jgi:hypothetical protein
LPNEAGETITPNLGETQMRTTALFLTALLISANSMADTIYTYDISASYSDSNIPPDTGTYTGTFQYDADTQYVTSVSGTLYDTINGTSQTTWSFDAANGINGFDASNLQGFPSTDFADFFANGDATTQTFTDYVTVLIAGIGTSTPTFDTTSQGFLFFPGNTVAGGNIPLVSGTITLDSISSTTSSVPEPASITLLAVGLFGLAAARKTGKRA